MEFAEGFAPTNRETIRSGPELAETYAVLRAWCVRAGAAPDHPETLFTRHSIAQEMAMRGKRVAAEAEFRDILAAQLRVQGPDHPHTLDARSEIAAAPP